MNPTSTELTVSIWRAATRPSAFAPLHGDLEVDVAIVGGGITGILCAQELRASGLRCAVIEAGRVGEGSTGNSTGNLYAMAGQHDHALASNEVAAQVWTSRQAAVDRLEALVKSERIDCDFARRPWVLFSETEDGTKPFERIRAIARQSGHVIRDGAGELPFKVAGAIAIDQQAQFNPLRFTRGLAQRLAEAGIGVHESTTVTGIDAESSGCTLATTGGRVRARWVVLATHTPKGVLKVHAALGPYREYGVALPVAAGTRLPQAIGWSTEPDRHSLRSYSFDGRNYLVVVGAHHKTGQAQDTRECFAALERYARKRFEAAEVAHRWSAQGYRSADSLPYIGDSALGHRVLYASGFAADGLTYAAVAAPILAAHVRGERHPEAELYAAGRFTPVASASSLIKENLNVLEQYFKDVPGAADADEFAQVRRGQGKTIARSGEKLAVYRDDAGEVHVVSAVCTHMQCLVAFNKAERSWDCPCHGSRFTVDGEVIEGPALEPLAPRGGA